MDLNKVKVHSIFMTDHLWSSKLNIVHFYKGRWLFKAKNGFSWKMTTENILHLWFILHEITVWTFFLNKITNNCKHHNKNK